MASSPRVLSATRLRLLWLGAVGFAWVAASSSACAAASAETPGSDGSSSARPNIIFVLADDHRYDAFGALTQGLSTPHLDRLLREGIHYRNAFVTTSLCSPSRASILSGQTMRRHGVVDNNSPTPADFEPFPTRLKAAGYHTAFVGKWHMGRSDASPKPGFDHWVSFEGQGNYGPQDAFGQPSLLNVNGQPVPQKGYITDELTRYALEWLEQQGDEPFFLYLSHKAVHLPFTPAERHATRYASLEVPVPATADPAARIGPTPMWLAAQRNSWSGVDFAYYSNRPYQAFQRDYYGALSAVDDGIGALLQYLDARDRDTVLIYSSDNGFMFGEQGLLDKRAAYEASIRVPLVIYAPGRLPASRDDGLARNIDLAPTMLDLAGLKAPAHYDGRSLLQGDRSRFDEPLVYEYYWEFNYPQTPSTFAVRDERYKYIQYHGVWDTEELFDLEADPQEQVNLIDQAEHAVVRDRMRAALYAALSQHGAEEDARPQIPFTARFNRGAVFWNPEASEGLRFPPAWSRDSEAADKYEHFLPDGPTKAPVLKSITPGVRQVLDGNSARREPSSR